MFGGGVGGGGSQTQMLPPAPVAPLPPPNPPMFGVDAKGSGQTQRKIQSAQGYGGTILGGLGGDVNTSNKTLLGA